MTPASDAPQVVEVYCTNPNCPSPNNTILAVFLESETAQQRYCGACRMELILQRRYLPMQPIGRGGFGQTFLARDLHFSQHLCVLKQLRPHIEPEQLESAQRLFRIEAEILKQLQHSRIPRVNDRFTLVVPDSEQRLFYLEQDYVPGVQNDLPENLLQELERCGPFSEAKVRELLKSLLPVLDYLHIRANGGRGLIHRDIKPANIIRQGSDQSLHLIDFGAVKRKLEIGVPAGQSMVIGTQGYAPPEQLLGYEIDDTADLYALATTCVHLLTGQHPSKFVSNWNFDSHWRQHVTIQDSLFNVLQQMLSSQPKDRYPSAQDVLAALRQDVAPPTSNPPQVPDTPDSNELPTQLRPEPELPGKVSPAQPQKRKLFSRRWLIALVLGLLALLLAVGLHNWLSGSPQAPPDNLSRRFSLGEKLLIDKDPMPTPEKRAGAEAFDKEEYTLAVQKFQETLTPQSGRNDPESRIYLNNAKIYLDNKNSNREFYRIAVSVPIGKNLNIAQEILRGVAQAQNEVNQLGNRITNGIGLQVEIIDDDNDPKIAKQVATELANDPKILAVVGHNRSDPSLAAAPIYQEKGLVMIAPTGFASELTGAEKDYIFRTVIFPDFMPELLVTHFLETAKKSRVVVCFDGKSKDSISFKEQFTRSLSKQGGTIIPISCNFAEKLDPKMLISQAIKAGADSLLLSPDVDRLNPAIDIASANKALPDERRLALFGSAALYTITPLEEAGPAFDGLVLAAPWHRDVDARHAFTTKAEELWGGQVSWRTAMAYDAARALIAGLQIGSTREKLQRVLRDRNFQTTGTSNIEFLDTGDRKGKPVLVKVQRSSDPNSSLNYEFALLR
jgi:ABC-type branched-subunit amino acid transport system substrate-binding protein